MWTETNHRPTVAAVISGITTIKSSTEARGTQEDYSLRPTDISPPFLG